MKYCLICAMKTEAKFLEAASTLLKEEKVGFGVLQTREYKGNAFYLCVCGIGKVLSASSASAILATKDDVDVIINFGVGGSLDSSVAPIFHAFIADKVCQHDMDTSPLGDPIGFLSGPNVIYVPCDEKVSHRIGEVCSEMDVPYAFGVASSGDRFIIKDEDKKWVKDNFGAISVDMEGGAIGEVAYVYNKPYALLRVVTDDEDHVNEYEKNKEAASKRLSAILLSLLEED